MARKNELAKPRTDYKKNGMTQISISLPLNLVEQIDMMASLDNRNRSNYISNELQKLAKAVRTVDSAQEKEGK